MGCHEEDGYPEHQGQDSREGDDNVDELRRQESGNAADSTHLVVRCEVSVAQSYPPITWYSVPWRQAHWGLAVVLCVVCILS